MMITRLNCAFVISAGITELSCLLHSHLYHMRVPISLIARIACWPVWNTKTPIAFLGTNLMAAIMFSYILNAICDFFIANSKLVSFHRFPGILGNVYTRNSSSSQNERRERPPLITCILSLILFIASTISFLLRHKPPQKALT